MHQHYFALHYTIAEEQYEQAYTALSDLSVPYLGIEEGHDELTIYYIDTGETVYQSTVEQHIRQAFQMFEVTFKHQKTTLIEEQNWNQEWENSIEPVWVNERIVICPSWKKHTVSASVTVLINPKMSFGTGHHETTRMTAQLLEQCVQQGSTWIDVGTGTGVLAILAVYCGAETVQAFDNDEWSVNNTIDNFSLNKIALKSNYSVFKADVNTVMLIQCNGITANLHKNLLDANFPRFYDALSSMKGDLLISGLLKYDRNDIVQRAQECGFQHCATVSEGEWIAIHFTV
jgi:ribosomal protein L11 methyltransferase